MLALLIFVVIAIFITIKPITGDLEELLYRSTKEEKVEEKKEESIKDSASPNFVNKKEAEPEKEEIIEENISKTVDNRNDSPVPPPPKVEEEITSGNDLFDKLTADLSPEMFLKDIKDGK